MSFNGTGFQCTESARLSTNLVSPTQFCISSYLYILTFWFTQLMNDGAAQLSAFSYPYIIVPIPAFFSTQTGFLPPIETVLLFPFPVPTSPYKPRSTPAQFHLQPWPPAPVPDTLSQTLCQGTGSLLFQFQPHFQPSPNYWKWSKDPYSPDGVCLKMNYREE